MRFLLFAFLLAMNTSAQYSVTKEVVAGRDVYLLRDSARQVDVRVCPTFGNNAYEMTVKGKPVLWMPTPDLASVLARPSLGGNPFLWPWANRIDGTGLKIDDTMYSFRMDLGNIRTDGNKKPIHGLLLYSENWKVERAAADSKGAQITSVLEYWKHPPLAAQFPFAHTVRMTYRLSEGALEVVTEVENQSTKRMPVSLGFHPYFQITDAPRDEWQVELPADREVVLSKELIPTGETRPNPYSGGTGLRGIALDNVFTKLQRDGNGWSVFRVKGKQQAISVEYGPEYPVAVVYAPAGRSFICFEPMSGITNAVNAAAGGLYDELQWIAPGGRWSGTFRIRTSGY